jgi:drug/metabolite transporter (DMT)-like permease
LESQRKPEQKSDEIFWSKLRDDMLQTRARRAQLQLAKIASIGTLVSAASIIGGNSPSILFAYVVPFLALGFDFLILGESFTLRRMGRFVVWYGVAGSAEQKWEKFVRKNPLRFSTFGNLVFTLICLFCSVFLLVSSAQPRSSWFSNDINIVWLCTIFILFLSSVAIEFKFRKKWRRLSKADDSENSEKSEKKEL